MLFVLLCYLLAHNRDLHSIDREGNGLHATCAAWCPAWGTSGAEPAGMVELGVQTGILPAGILRRNTTNTVITIRYSKIRPVCAYVVLTVCGCETAQMAGVDHPCSPPSPFRLGFGRIVIFT